jgi:hypothetical protein
MHSSSLPHVSPFGFLGMFPHEPSVHTKPEPQLLPSGTLAHIQLVPEVHCLHAPAHALAQQNPPSQDMD